MTNRSDNTAAARTKAAIFLAALPPALLAEAEALPDLDEVLGRAVDAARHRWPDLLGPAEEERYLVHVAATRRASDPLGASLRDLHAADLLVAWACGERRESAIRHVEATCFEDLDRVFRRYAYLGRDLADVRQTVRERLFVGDGASGPKIREYSAKAALRSWLRAVFTNLVANVAGRESREVPVDDALIFALPDDKEGAEITHLKEVYKHEFRAAFVGAIDGLSSREKNVLRYVFAEGLSLEQVAAIYGVHRATASRWLASARESLASAMRADLVARLRVTDQELASILRVALSRVEITLARYLNVRG